MHTQISNHSGCWNKPHLPYKVRQFTPSGLVSPLLNIKTSHELKFPPSLFLLQERSTPSVKWTELKNFEEGIWSLAPGWWEPAPLEPCGISQFSWGVLGGFTGELCPQTYFCLNTAQATFIAQICWSKPTQSQLKHHVPCSCRGVCNCCRASTRARGCSDFTQLSNKGKSIWMQQYLQ